MKFFWANRIAPDETPRSALKRTPGLNELTLKCIHFVLFNFVVLRNRVLLANKYVIVERVL